MTDDATVRRVSHQCLHCEEPTSVYIRAYESGYYGTEITSCVNPKCTYGRTPERMAPEWVLKEFIELVELERPIKEGFHLNK